ncbi:MAG: ChbG/HpnK family deacetylase [Actinomycetota bacterium]|nr:ChbG/HpnK family deacetylase [Actinomycetota bacterium]
MSPLLIVNADDYGLTQGISEGILRGHREGIVTSTSVLAIGPAYPKVAHLLADHPALGVGVHLAVVGEDPPLLSGAEVPTLFDRRGRLYETFGPFLLRCAAGRVDPEDVRREFTAQLVHVQELGLPITHLDAHQHLHLWPSICNVVLELARQFGIPAVRVPRLRAFTVTGAGVTVLGRLLARRAARAGLRFPTDAVGIECAGQLTPEVLQRVLGRLAGRGADTVELTVHPGEDDDPDRARYVWGYQWDQELETLIGAPAREVVTSYGFTLGTYADLPVPAASGE